MTLLSNALAKRIVVPIDSLLHRGLEPVIIRREVRTRVRKLPIGGVVQEELEVGPKGTAVRNGLRHLRRERAISCFGIKPSLRLGGRARAGEQAVQPVRDADEPTAVVRHVDDQVRRTLRLERGEAVLEYLEPLLELCTGGEAPHGKNADIAVKVETRCAEASDGFWGLETWGKSDILYGSNFDER